MYIGYSSPLAPANAPPGNTLFLRILQFSTTTFRYLALHVWPYPLCADYALRMNVSELLPRAVGALVALAALAAVAFRFRRRFAPGWEGLAAFLLLLTPVSNIVPLLHAMAIRYLTLPCAAFCWALAHALGAVRSRRWRLASLAGLLAIYGGMSAVRANQWRTAHSLWSFEARHNPKSSSAVNNLGNVLEKEGKIEEAKAAYLQAISINPRNMVAQNNYGSILLREGDNEEAERYFRAAIAESEIYASARINLGVALRRMGRSDEAIAQYRKAIELDPDYPGAYVNLANALVDTGRIGEAADVIAKAIQIDPRNSALYNNRGALLIHQLRYHEAAECFAQGIRMIPDNAELYANLGAAYKAIGQTDQAKEALQTALALARQANNADLAQTIESKLAALDAPETAP
ncbi:MAG: lipoprotein NlpI [candidate division BRC1 bacterium ADurb.BinA364]|nr:MAG: lipoprotein NlpI [candidate division BRC1 bacterium ADurb.BinA364]